jgi:hypothetical protein
MVGAKQMSIAEHIYLVWMVVRGLDLHTGLHTAGYGYWDADLHHATSAAVVEVRSWAPIHDMPAGEAVLHECESEDCEICRGEVIYTYADFSRIRVDVKTQEVWVE